MAQNSNFEFIFYEQTPSDCTQANFDGEGFVSNSKYLSHKSTKFRTLFRFFVFVVGFEEIFVFVSSGYADFHFVHRSVSQT